MKANIQFLGFLIVALISTSANALLFDEATNFDLNGDQNNPSYLGVLDPGLNRILGTHTFFETGFGQGDTFSVDIPVGSEIIGIDLIISNLTGFLGDTRTSSDVFFTPPFGGFAGGEIHPITADGIYSYTSLLPQVSPASYGFSVQYAAIDFAAGADPSYDWEWQISTSAVPIPPAMLLFISGLVGIVGLAKRRYGK